MLGFKEKKQKKEEQAASAKADAEFQAKYVAKQEKRKVEKNIAEIDKSIANFIAKAAEAKAKGYTDIYKKSISFIKTARVRKKQAEMFLFQMDAMQEMQNISKNSSELLTSMNNVMNSLGALSLDRAVVMTTQRDFLKTQTELDKQSDNIENALSGMEMQIMDDDGLDALSDDGIEAEIAALMAGNSADALSVGSSVSVEKNADSEMEYLQKMLNN
ncbi:hypothetical protein EOM82_06500 [bacterium]|nr:hypothetical protein [bacterium]